MDLFQRRYPWMPPQEPGVLGPALVDLGRGQMKDLLVYLFDTALPWEERFVAYKSLDVSIIHAQAGDRETKIKWLRAMARSLMMASDVDPTFFGERLLIDLDVLPRNDPSFDPLSHVAMPFLWASTPKLMTTGIVKFLQGILRQMVGHPQRLWGAYLEELRMQGSTWCPDAAQNASYLEQILAAVASSEEDTDSLAPIRRLRDLERVRYKTEPNERWTLYSSVHPSWSSLDRWMEAQGGAGTDG